MNQETDFKERKRRLREEDYNYSLCLNFEILDKTLIRRSED
jgi:hypothetical protein